MQSLNSCSVAADRALCCLSALHLALVGHCHLKNCLLMGQKKSDIKDKDFILYVTILLSPNLPARSNSLYLLKTALVFVALGNRSWLLDVISELVVCSAQSKWAPTHRLPKTMALLVWSVPCKGSLRHELNGQQTRLWQPVNATYRQMPC